MTENYQNGNDQEIVVRTPKETTIIKVDDDGAERIGELVEKALLRRETPFVSKGDSIFFVLVKEGN